MIFLKIWMTKNVFSRFFPRLVEAIHIELSNETIYIFVSEIFGQNCLFKLLYVLNSEFFPVSRPLDDF